ncbi:hypothetical protein R1flu_006948 [Riccia fluitans]|uniref:Uncharacterized protein n=1 Tax=Riccia fluitans TaxID=41844 RepID=A0ABD1Z062_9MARC
MAARGPILRASRRPVSQINRNVALCYSAASRSHFVQIERLEAPARASSKVVLVKGDSHFQHAIKQVQGASTLSAALLWQ